MSLKKSALSTAIAGALAAAAFVPAVTMAAGHTATPDVYGRVHWRLVSAKDQDMDIPNAEARLGTKYSGDTDGGLKAGAQLELAIRDGGTSAFGSRDTEALQWRQVNASLGGDFGTVKIGRQSNPYADVYKSDMFEANSGAFEAAPFRLGNAIIYSGGAGPVNFAVGVVMENQGTDDGTEDLDGTVLAASFAAGPVDITIANQSTAEDGSAGAKTNITGIGVNWQSGPLQLAAFTETESESETTHLDIGVLFNVSPTTKVGADIATCSNDTDGVCSATDSETRTMLGVYHRLGGGADTYLEFGQVDEADTSNVTGGFRVVFN